jgi:hypothetical protein
MAETGINLGRSLEDLPEAKAVTANDEEAGPRYVAGGDREVARRGLEGLLPEAFRVFEGPRDGLGDGCGDLEAPLGLVVLDAQAERLERLSLDLRRRGAQLLGEVGDGASARARPSRSSSIS